MIYTLSDPDEYKGKHILVAGAGDSAIENALSPFGVHIDEYPVTPARLFGLADRGRLSPGAYADIVVFDPDAIAETYWATLQQHRSAWSWEVEVRPWVEKF